METALEQIQLSGKGSTNNGAGINGTGSNGTQPSSGGNIQKRKDSLGIRP